MIYKKFLLFLLLLISTLKSIAQADRLNVIVDEKLELLNTIQYLSGYPILTKADTRYKKEIEAYFKPFRQHKAVILNKEIYERFFGFDAPPSYIYYFSFPDFKQIAPFSKEDLDAYHFDLHNDTLSMLLTAFKDFYEKSHFHNFFVSHKRFYDSLARPVKNEVIAKGVIQKLETHYQQKNKEYTVVLGPMLHDGGYGLIINTATGNLLYAIIGPQDDTSIMPVFDIDDLLSYYILHEFSHSFCNVLITQNMQSLQRDSCLLNPIRKSMKAQGYGTWETCLKEHLVRANEIVLTEDIFGKEKADELAAEMKDQKWIYLDGLIAIVRQYVASKQQYKTEADIMPLVVEYFHNKARDCK